MPVTIMSYGFLAPVVQANPDSPACDKWFTTPTWDPVAHQWVGSPVYIIPDRFESWRELASAEVLNLPSLVFISTVEAGASGKPVYKVTDANGYVYQGAFPSTPWTLLIKRIKAACEAQGIKPSASLVSGPKYFGFSPQNGPPEYLNNHAAALDNTGQFTRFWKAYLHIKSNRPPPIDYSNQAYQAALLAALAAGTLPMQLAAAAAAAVAAAAAPATPAAVAAAAAPAAQLPVAAAGAQ